MLARYCKTRRSLVFGEDPRRKGGVEPLHPETGGLLRLATALGEGDGHVEHFEEATDGDMSIGAEDS